MECCFVLTPIQISFIENHLFSIRNILDFFEEYYFYKQQQQI